MHESSPAEALKVKYIRDRFADACAKFKEYDQMCAEMIRKAEETGKEGVLDNMEPYLAILQDAEKIYGDILKYGKLIAANPGNYGWKEKDMKMAMLKAGASKQDIDDEKDYDNDECGDLVEVPPWTWPKDEKGKDIRLEAIVNAKKLKKFLRS